MRYRYRWNEQQIERRIKKGFGQGYKENYQPWLTVQDVPSSGVVVRVRGRIVPRVYHFMSQLEYKYFCILEWSDRINDIREQFPLLQREDAQLIADQKGITYPRYPKTGVPVVMTSDFAIQLLDKNNNIKEVIRTVKPSCELKKKRVLEKLEIEREYWKRRKVDWGIVTEKELCPILLHNLQFFQGCFYYNERIPVLELAPCFLEEIINSQDQLVLQLLHRLDSQYSQKPGIFLALFKFLLSRKMVSIDMSKKIDLQKLICSEIKIIGGADLSNAIYKNDFGYPKP